MSARRSALFINENPQVILKGAHMIIYFSAVLNEIHLLGSKYPWPKPDVCPRCNRCRVWGHGFITAYFDGYNDPLPLKRYRCPDCGCIMRLRPKGYFKRFQASITTIRSSVVYKIRFGKWIDGISRSRQQHWFKSLIKRIKAHLTDAWQQGVLAGFDYFLKSGQAPVSRSI